MLGILAVFSRVELRERTQTSHSAGMRRKRWVWVAVALSSAMAIVVAFSPFWIPKNDPRLIGKVPPGMVLTPRSAFAAKPWIDLPWFGGKRLRFPKTSSLPTGFDNDASVSGIVTWQKAASWGRTLLRAPLRSGTVDLNAVLFTTGTWMDEEAQKTELLTNLDMTRIYFGAGEEFARLPYVYGDRSLRFKVSWADPGSVFGPTGTKPTVVTAQFELPPNHQPAPIRKRIEVPLREGKLVLTPLPEISPGFARRFTVTVEGKSMAKTYLIEFRSVTEESISSADLIIEEGKRAVYSHQSKGDGIVVVVRTTEPEKIELRATLKRKSPGSPALPNVYDLKDSKGTVLAFASDDGVSSATILPIPGNPKLLNLTVDGSPPQSGGYTRGEPELDRTLAIARATWSKTPLRLKNGMRVGATIYRELCHEAKRISLR